MITSLVEAFLLGLVGGAVPGPILTGTFTEILNLGFLKGIRVIFYALIAETIGALLVFLIFYAIGLNQLAIQIISVCGALVLFWLGSQVWKIKEINTEAKKILTFPKIILLTAFNSGYWIFWITIGVPKALALNNSIPGGKFIFLAVFELAWLIMTFALAFIFYQFRPLLQRKNLIETTFKVLATILVLLGIKTLFSAF
ncbi:MAG: LysE family transporter [Candidatus Paceibacterota bacterium]|jgi:threonine/homoserine/homoserine lactone efflux protein